MPQSNDPYAEGHPVRQLPRADRKSEGTFNARNVVTGVTIAALSLAAISSIGLIIKTRGIQSDLNDLKVETGKDLGKVTAKLNYLELAQQQGLVVVSAHGRTLNDIVADIQSKLSPGNLEKATETVSIKEDKGFYLATLKDRTELRPIREATVEAAAVTIAFLKPSDPDVLARIQKSYPTIELSPSDLENQASLGFKGHLSKIGAATPKAEQFKERQLVGGAVELRIKNLFTAEAKKTPDQVYALKSDLVSFLRKSAGSTTFDKTVAVSGTHATIASKITGASQEDSRHFSNLLEIEVPKLIAGKDFTIKVTPVFLENYGKDLVCYFGSTADLARFKERFFPIK